MTLRRDASPRTCTTGWKLREAKLPRLLTGAFWSATCQSDNLKGMKVSFLDKLEAAKAVAVAPVDPWRLRLERVRGKIDFDGLERVSTQTLLDMLEVPQRTRTAGTYRRLAKLMADLGWTALRVRDLTRGGYKEQVRGYVRGGRR
jgi:hypothetical protein